MAADYAELVEAYRARWRMEAERARERAAELMTLSAVLAGICRDYGARRVIVFGSVARGSTRPGGDIDLAVEGVAPQRFYDLYGRLLLESAVPLDLVDLGDCPASLGARIRDEGVEL